MPRGRRPKPTTIKLAQGNPGRRPLNADEPMPLRGCPACADWLHEYAKEVWAEVVPELDRLGLLTVVDRPALTALCQAWAEFRLATETLAKEGRTTVSPVSGVVHSHPAVQQQRTAWKAIQNFSSLFGLDPSSRTRIKVPPKEDGGEPFGKYQGKGTG